jgi:hypothetical protein
MLVGTGLTSVPNPNPLVDELCSKALSALAGTHRSVRPHECAGLARMFCVDDMMRSKVRLLRLTTMKILSSMLTVRVNSHDK